MDIFSFVTQILNRKLKPLYPKWSSFLLYIFSCFKEIAWICILLYTSLFLILCWNVRNLLYSQKSACRIDITFSLHVYQGCEIWVSMITNFVGRIDLETLLIFFGWMLIKILFILSDCSSYSSLAIFAQVLMCGRLEVFVPLSWIKYIQTLI